MPNFGASRRRQRGITGVTGVTLSLVKANLERLKTRLMQASGA